MMPSWVPATLVWSLVSRPTPLIWSNSNSRDLGLDWSADGNEMPGHPVWVTRIRNFSTTNTRATEARTRRSNTARTEHEQGPGDGPPAALRRPGAAARPGACIQPSTDRDTLPNYVNLQICPLRIPRSV